MRYALSSSLIVWLALAAASSCPGGSQPLPVAEPLATPAPGPEGESVAEQITRLQRMIAEDEDRLAHLKAERDDPEGEYAKAEATFAEVDRSLKTAREALEQLPPGDGPERADAEARVARLTRARELTKERFDLAIEGRKTTGEQIANLTQKIERGRQALKRLEGNGPEEPAPADPAPKAADTPTADGPATAAPATAPSAPAIAPPAPAIAHPAQALSGALAGGESTPPASAPAPASGTEAGAGEPADEGLAKAHRDAQAKAEASREAEAEARSATDRLESVDKDIALEQRLLATANRRRDNASESRAALTAAFRERSLAGAPREELDRLLARVNEVEERLRAANLDVRECSDRLQGLHVARAELQAEQIDSLKKAQAAKDQVEVAEKEIRRLENPFSAHNVLSWLVDHGPRILAILAAMALVHVLSRFFTERVIRLVAHDGARGSSVEREARARTLVGVFQNAVTVAVFIGGGMMVLQEAGIPIAPLLGGAAVFGLAVAFGAQNLIRDYFYGFVILLENQYKINDVVEIGGLSGQVEKITLRMTVLRDLEGRVHFLPNGQVTAVTNFTHGWSRALFEIRVDYREDVDRAIAVITGLCQQMRDDPTYSLMILEDVTMLGVDALDEWCVVIKFFIKTRPIQQWNVKRELLRRIKNRFDELGIRIPVPQQAVRYHAEEGGRAPFAEAPDGQPRILQA
ncbi:mechanosensitive ion channel domain-containing protein [Paludisphaera sp.]|uniref:mechanosensitive ion channel domain-containing protein n=1 Tax=Paludisphaera sp. TaxID=2017432 RepID=UPI00301CA810